MQNGRGAKQSASGEADKLARADFWLILFTRLFTYWEHGGLTDRT